MDEEQIEKIMRVLSDWNPLGERAVSIDDLDGYRTEAIDMIFHFSMSHTFNNTLNIVRAILNEAFNLSLSKDECAEPSRKILEIIRNK
ncbi:MAG TPA: hypothetical protein ENH23_07575 [candidate division Zixibacteria bacterium]|nr:hypothetical protein [candidate division Zixibacteria bacterium]